jgi:hypothetical protein
MAAKPKAHAGSVVVAGDVMVDWNLTVDRDVDVATRSWREAGKVRRVKQLGGAWLLADLVKNFAAETAYEGRVFGMAEPTAANESTIHQTYTVLARAADEVWRVQNFLGVESDTDGDLRIVSDRADADVVVLLDSDLGFENQKAAWPLAITTPKCRPWIVLKTSVPAFHGDLWQLLIANHAERLIVVMTVDDLRRKELQLLRRLSWERTAQDLVSEMRDSPALRALKQCQHVIVSFGTAGAMLLSRDDKPRLVFDPSSMEGEWETRDRGSMIGYTSVMAAAVTHEIMIHPEWPQLVDALPRGIAGMRALYTEGFGKGEQPVVATAHVARAALSGEKIVAAAVVKDTNAESWTILEDRLKHAAAISPDNDVKDVLYELAARVAVYGPEVALPDVPQLRIRNLFTVDRDEIESLGSIKGLLSEYMQRKPSKPFSIAVFGSPGSGKSFGVEEIAASVGGNDIKVLTFNLTQFAGPRDLHGAFHQVRDVSLKGQIPVVFWDEFDTKYGEQALGWLRYFIGPMQDGLFQEDQITHPIGTSVFVFAGGTATNKDDFVKGPPNMDEDERKALKVPDFISRLKGFLDVTGPNHREGETDSHFLIRRAILLRSMIQKHCPDLFRKEGKRRVLQIDPGVLHAFLNTKLYRHGARSLESVIAMSALASRKHFDSSSLPPEPQLELHVELPFESLVQGLKFTHDVVRLEQLAAKAHDVFCETKKALGWQLRPVRNDAELHHDLLKPYADLPEREKEWNRASVRWIPKKIAAEGFEVAPAGSGKAEDLPPDAMERLAEMEHNLWMERKRAAGYEYGPVAMESPKRSPYLVPWSQLGENEKRVDHDLIAAIPAIVRIAGCILVRKQVVPPAPPAPRKRQKRKR